MTDLKTILLVDDHAITMLARSQFLSGNGYNVMTAASGEEAVKTACSEIRVDLVLMDIDLGGGMDGTEAAELILARKDIPILFLSNHTEKEIVEKTGMISSYGYVVKESGDQVLLASINMAFRLYEARMDVTRQRNELNSSRAELEMLNGKFEVANRELQESLLYTRAILKNAPYGVFIADENGVFLEVNPAASSIAGFTEQELTGKNFRELLPGGIESAGLNSFIDTARHGRTSGEFPILRGDGSVRYWSVETAALSDNRYLGFVMDITRRRRDEATRKRQHRFIESLIETIPNPVFYKDTGLKYMGCNRAFEEITGKRRDEITGKTVFQLFEYELARRYNEADRELLGFTGNQYYEGKIKTAYGEYRDVMFSKSTFSGPENQVEGIVGVLTDITDLKKAEAAMSGAIEENRTLYMELQHRVKNTMNIITGIINIECDSIKDSPALKSLESIRNRVFTLSELYSLLYVSGNAKVVQLDRYLENVVKSLDLMLVSNSGIKISTRCASIEADVRVGTSMGLILNELVTNACMYAKTGAGGLIEVRLSSDDINFILEVEDNGTGLPAGFDIRKGAGLGLQLVSGLAMQHKGRVDVVQGSTTLFRVTVPGRKK